MRTLRVKTFSFLFLLLAALVAPALAAAQTSDSIPASASIREKHGVSSYRLSEAEAFFTLEAFRDDGSVALTAHWFGTPATADVSITVLDDGGGSLDVACSKGGADCLAFENSEARAVQDLSDASRALAAELNDYMGDVFGNAVANDCTAATTLSTPTFTKRSRLPFEGPTAKRLNDRQKRVMNGICYIAGVCTGFWPIGTLICGPTAVGCAVYYFTAS